MIGTECDATGVDDVDDDVEDGDIDILARLSCDVISRVSVVDVDIDVVAEIDGVADVSIADVDTGAVSNADAIADNGILSISICISTASIIIRASASDTI